MFLHILKPKSSLSDLLPYSLLKIVFWVICHVSLGLQDLVQAKCNDNSYGEKIKVYNVSQLIPWPFISKTGRGSYIAVCGKASHEILLFHAQSKSQEICNLLFGGFDSSYWNGGIYYITVYSSKRYPGCNDFF